MRKAVGLRGINQYTIWSIYWSSKCAWALCTGLQPWSTAYHQLFWPKDGLLCNILFWTAIHGGTKYSHCLPCLSPCNERQALFSVYCETLLQTLLFCQIVLSSGEFEQRLPKGKINVRVSSLRYQLSGGHPSYHAALKEFIFTQWKEKGSSDKAPST